MAPGSLGGGGRLSVDTGLSDSTLPTRVTSALAAAAIPPSKLGAARRARLSGPERELYLWILRHFATRGRPSSAAMRDAAAGLGLEGGVSPLATLARDDLVHLDGAGEIAVAYPFSGRPTVHRVRFRDGQEVYAMCAIDALGIAPMFEQAIAVISRDPFSGDEIGVDVFPSGDAYWQPESTVVVAGAVDINGDSCQSCCPVLNFFASAHNAERWLDTHRHVRGQVITMQEAILAGRAVFGDVLKAD